MAPVETTIENVVENGTATDEFVIEHTKCPDIAVPPNVYHTEYFLDKLKQNTDNIAMINAATGETISYAELRSSILIFSLGLPCVFKHFAPLDCVLLMLTNGPEFVAAQHGTLAASGRLSATSFLNGPYEIDHCLTLSGASVMIVNHDKLAMVVEVLNKRSAEGRLCTPFGLVVVDSTPSDETKINSESVNLPESVTLVPYAAVAEAGKKQLQTAAKSLDAIVDECVNQLRQNVNVETDWVGLYYSSGTTGLPKGVMHSHSTLLAMNMICNAGVELALNERIQAILPFYHMFGNSEFVFSALSQGATLVFRSVFDQHKLFSDIADYQLRASFMVPPLILKFTQDEKCLQYDLTSLRRVYSSAAPLSATIEHAARLRLPHLELFGQLYGLTETGCQLVWPLPTAVQNCAAKNGFNRSDNGEQTFTGSRKHEGSSGCVYPGVRAKLVDLHDPHNTIAKPGERGQLCLKSPSTFLGYCNNDEATREMMLYNDGWIYTGDIAYFDDERYIYVVDRIKEMIKYKGHQIAPAELEAVLLSQPHVVDAAVIGIPAPHEFGQYPFAFVVAADAIQLDAAALADAVSQSLAAYKKLRAQHIVFIARIPKSAAGKILRRVLRDQYAQMNVAAVLAKQQQDP